MQARAQTQTHNWAVICSILGSVDCAELLHLPVIVLSVFRGRNGGFSTILCSVKINTHLIFKLALGTDTDEA